MLYDFKQTSRQKKSRLTKFNLTKIGRFSLFLSAVTLLALLVFTLKETNLPPPSDFDQLKKEILNHPRDPQTHLRLARFLFQVNDFEAAKKELLLALSFNPDFQEAEDLEAQIKNQETEPERIKAKIQNWEEVLAEKPGYRDAYLQIAILNWQIYKKGESQEALGKVFEFDPNFKAGENLKKIFSE